MLEAATQRAFEAWVRSGILRYVPIRLAFSGQPDATNLRRHAVIYAYVFTD